MSTEPEQARAEALAAVEEQARQAPGQLEQRGGWLLRYLAAAYVGALRRPEPPRPEPPSNAEPRP